MLKAIICRLFHWRHHKHDFAGGRKDLHFMHCDKCDHSWWK